MRTTDDEVVLLLLVVPLLLLVVILFSSCGSVVRVVAVLCLCLCFSFFVQCCLYIYRCIEVLMEEKILLLSCRVVSLLTLFFFTRTCTRYYSPFDINVLVAWLLLTSERRRDIVEDCMVMFIRSIIA